MVLAGGSESTQGSQYEEKGKSPHPHTGGAPTAPAAPWKSLGEDGGSHLEDADLERSELEGLNFLNKGTTGQDTVVTSS